MYQCRLVQQGDGESTLNCWRNKIVPQKPLRSYSYCLLQGEQLDWDLNKQNLSLCQGIQSPINKQEADGGTTFLNFRTEGESPQVLDYPASSTSLHKELLQHKPVSQFTPGPPRLWNTRSGLSAKGRNHAHSLSAFYFPYLSAPHPQPSIWASYHLKATLNREISQPSGVWGTETLKLELQRAHSLKCSVLASLSIWAPCSLYTAPKWDSQKATETKTSATTTPQRMLPDTANNNM